LAVKFAIFPGPDHGWTQLEMLMGLSLGLGIMSLALQTWGLQKTWLHERDVHQELLDRTPALYRLLSRISLQAGSRPLDFDGSHWQAAATYAGWPGGGAPTWVHARGIHDQASSYPNCQNIRAWAKDSANAPALIRDQFDWIDGQLKCKDTSQTGARWQGWVDQVKNWKVWLAWQSGEGSASTWRWRSVEETPSSGVAVGMRMCLILESAQPIQTRPDTGLDCLDLPLLQSGRESRNWTRVWAMRTGQP
jgi:hypothetical protein